MVYNVSAKGLKVVINSPEVGTVAITDFPDDATPVSIAPLETNKCKFDINGEIVPFSKCAEWSVSVSTIPGSKQDGQLMALVLQTSYKGVEYTKKDISMTIDNFIIHASLSEGRVQTGGGAEAQNSGRWKGNTYTFFFKNNKIQVK